MNVDKKEQAVLHYPRPHLLEVQGKVAQSSPNAFGSTLTSAKKVGEESSAFSGETFSSTVARTQQVGSVAPFR